jgi:fumarylacetoacetase
VSDDDGYGPEHLPYGVATSPLLDRPTPVTRLGARVVDLRALAADGLLPGGRCWDDESLDAFLAAGPLVWQDVRDALQAICRQPDAAAVERASYPLEAVSLVLPFTVADFVDFYASEQHATNLGRLLRPGQPPLLPNWHHLPVGYHGRSGTVRVSGTPVIRPSGQRRGDAEAPVFGPTERLDVEAEVGFVVGVPSVAGQPVPTARFADHVFGVCLVNDWSARDIQAWEYQPLGPFLGKSFHTSVGAWLTPLAALEAARVTAPSGQSELLPHLRDVEPWGLDLSLELSVNGSVVSRPPYRTTHWSPAQMLAHLTSNGAQARTGDLFASGTVSGSGDDEVGSLFELWEGERFLADGDEVVITATAPGPGGATIRLGEVRGRVVGADGR